MAAEEIINSIEELCNCNIQLSRIAYIISQEEYSILLEYFTKLTSRPIFEVNYISGVKLIVE